MTILDRVVRPVNGFSRSRWLLFPFIGMDTLCTLLGQPAKYWKNPAIANEYNDFFRIFVVQGPAIFIVTSLLYILSLVIFVGLLPGRLAGVLFFALTLGHYLGACSWILGSFGFGMWVAVVYAVAIASLMSAFGFSMRTTLSQASP